MRGHSCSAHSLLPVLGLLAHTQAQTFGRACCSSICSTMLCCPRETLPFRVEGTIRQCLTEPWLMWRPHSPSQETTRLGRGLLLLCPDASTPLARELSIMKPLRFGRKIHLLLLFPGWIVFRARELHFSSSQSIRKNSNLMYARRTQQLVGSTLRTQQLHTNGVITPKNQSEFSHF